jgi:hypothetical protein
MGRDLMVHPFHHGAVHKDHSSHGKRRSIARPWNVVDLG